MNRYNIKSIITAVLFCILVTACDDDDPFGGNDNYIKSFSLKQGETIFNAAFRNDSIIVSPSVGTSLDGATAEVLLSENAKISPDPASITNWNEEALFVVTSYNGERKTYKYVVERNNVSVPGTIALYTQADVDAFGASGVTLVAGNLIIGRPSGSDSIRTLLPLTNLKEIGYNLVLNSTFAGTDLLGLDNLEIAGGIEIGSLRKKLVDVSLPKLSKLTLNLNISSDSIKSVSLSKLKEVGGYANITSRSLSVLPLPGLERVGGNLTLSNTWVNGRTSSFNVSLPKLKTCGDLSLNANEMILQAPALEKCGGISYYSDMNFKILSFPALKEINGTFQSSNNAVNILNIPSLTHIAGDLNLSKGAMGFIDLSALKEIDGNLILTNIRSIKNLSGFSSLTNVSGNITLTDAGNLTSLDLLNLKSVKSLEINGSPKLTEIDIKGREIETLTLKNMKSIKITGNEFFDGTLTLQSCESPELIGFKKIKDLTVYLSGTTDNQLTNDFPSITNITGSLNVSGRTAKIQFSNLKKIGGNLVVGHDAKMEIQLTNLEEVAGGLTYAASADAADFSSTGFQISKLKTIGGQLLIKTAATQATLRELDAFYPVTTIKEGVSVDRMRYLVSYEGLKNAIHSFSSDKWSATNNAYNPTYQDLLDGKWVKP